MVASHKSHNHKLKSTWGGPFQVVDTINSPFVYRVHLIGDPNNEMNVHINRIKRLAGHDLNRTAQLVKSALHNNQSFQVENIVGWRMNDNEIELQIHWLGWDVCDRTWEPATSLYQDVPNLVINYLNGIRDEHARIRELINTLG